MDKIIGKSLLTMCLLSVFCLQATDPSIKLRLCSIDGQEVEQVAVGEPFRIEVLIEGMGQAPKTIDVPGLDKINARRNGYFLTTLNGVSSVKFNYQAQLDKPTFAWIGPVTVEVDGKEIRSNKLRVIAKLDSLNPGARTAKKKEIAENLLRFYVDKKDAVVGEKIIARLRFYSRSGEVHVRQLNQRELPAFTMTALEGPTSGQEMIDNQMYHYAEWRWNLYPREVGKLVIPAYSIDFDAVRSRNSQWSFLSFFGNQMENKRVHSNAQVITVRALPPHKGSVFLVGRLTDVTAEVSPDTTKVGDAALLAIEIEGEGNIEGIEKLTLTGIPDALKYYDSKNVIVGQPKTSRFTRKRFEFILQGMQDGAWEIPPQTFTYYDIENRAYEQKSTTPLKITILPGPAPEPSEVADNELQKLPQEAPVIELGPINTKGPWNLVNQRSGLAWWIFVLLILLPIGSIGAALVWQWAYDWYARRSRYSKAYKRAHNQLVVAQTVGDSRRIYYIMRSAIADRTRVSVDQISPESIHKVLHTAGISPERLEAWDRFSGLLTQQVFAYNDHKPELFAMAHQWLNEWEGLL